MKNIMSVDQFYRANYPGGFHQQIAPICKIVLSPDDVAGQKPLNYDWFALVVIANKDHIYITTKAAERTTFPLLQRANL
ncbi:hypothetical protein M514_12112 [Trichuris suis]|uniref:Uncharacterized protein n=1 Tax=Trichuris suis TaxID=68888 RepID=A0A085LPY4_9BILA|nr:hypothetical protein M513_12112 [Trichuris suis]KFD61022.1 hypothetical protein M514_12112 [Trichuris suis]